ncbi:MAG: hypothetical protein QN165_01580 [Armatimonadota bacterium]|nr:hypothetical protein [Armatimonadota bacterium]MDR7513483.1 hypothetical protein [Armatimonadota bacterium]MDR7566681.1 hypothetical protein [Armatimonadota bacterium]MDR7594992.1 hypothetical protein [Armatimonadota bacterium]
MRRPGGTRGDPIPSPYRAGLSLPPAVGALLMSLSTVIVALNASLLRRARLS